MLLTTPPPVRLNAKVPVNVFSGLYGAHTEANSPCVKPPGNNVGYDVLPKAGRIQMFVSLILTSPLVTCIMPPNKPPDLVGTHCGTRPERVPNTAHFAGCVSSA